MSTISSIGGSGNAWAANAPPRPPQPGQMAQKVFSALDADGSGAISGSELEDVMGSDASGLLGELDSDGDGNVSQSELTSGVQSLMPPPASTMDFVQQRASSGSDGSDSSGDDAELFSQLDTDGNGSLSQGEFEAALSSGGGTDRAGASEGQRTPPPPGPPPGDPSGSGEGGGTTSSSDVTALRQMLADLYAQLGDSSTAGASSGSTSVSVTA